MSTSLLYHAFGLKGVKYHSTEFIGNAIIFGAEMTDKFIKCPDCNCRKAIFKGQQQRWFRMSPIGGKQCILKVLLHRLKCYSCGKLWWPSLPFMNGKCRYTRGFATTVLDLLQFGTIRSVAHYLCVGWDLVKEIHKSKLRRLYRKIPLHKVRYLLVLTNSVFARVTRT
jgi:transposase